ncbi:alpha/beta hydrolase [Pedobacter nyackensis]|uniref:alpha/beta hydrolase n=1 Tax=Pedobacter nyackensis TaxID=475255 RepID=UPI00292CBC8C|nr:alpha/beta hydrolase [Pedobacter nyackensis]
MALLLFCPALKAQEIVNLYPGAIPGAKVTPETYVENAETGTDGITRVSKVSQPTLTVFLPPKEKATGAAVIICPGGGYGILAISHEGYDVAKRFNDIGVAAFVLKYRLPSAEIMKDPSFGPLQDAQQAIYMVRLNAKQWNIMPSKIGIMGFSAGGHLAASLTVHYDDVKIQNEKQLSLRPDFSILIYPVVTFGAATHMGSRKNLLGEAATEAQLKYFSNETGVNSQSPPTFMVHANDDKAVPSENSILFNQALVKAGVKAEMHLYQAGGHGFGLKNKTTTADWFKLLESWMKDSKFL